MKVGFVIDTAPTMSRKNKPNNMSFLHQARYQVEAVIKRHHQNTKYFLATSEQTKFMKSEWEHPKEHLFRQIEYFKHAKTDTNLMQSVKKVLATMNAYRFINGSDNPINGICISKMRPYLLCIFTDDVSISKIDETIFDHDGSSKYGNYDK